MLGRFCFCDKPKEADPHMDRQDKPVIIPCQLRLNPADGSTRLSCDVDSLLKALGFGEPQVAVGAMEAEVVEAPVGGEVDAAQVVDGPGK